MLFFIAVLYGILVRIAHSQILAATDPAPPPPNVPIGVSKAPFAKVAGRLFELDGHVGYFAGKHRGSAPPEQGERGLTEKKGTNSWWLGHLSNNSDVDLVLQQLVEARTSII